MIPSVIDLAFFLFPFAHRIGNRSRVKTQKNKAFFTMSREKVSQNKLQRVRKPRFSSKNAGSTP